MKKMLLADSHARQRALDIGISCIVQAPAGSGKTELLTLRYLKLLSVSEQPEEVLAITFTRKAASEMRDRILSTLAWVDDVELGRATIKEEFEKQRFAIAKSVIEHDQASNWNLLKNPSRLRVQTIDSFCFYLANQLPVLSNVGGNPVLSEDVSHIYTHAIANTLSHLEQEGSLALDLQMLLQHVDNNVGKVEKLLGDLLQQRDQWVAHVLFIKHSNQDAQTYLRDNLTELAEESLELLYGCLEPETSTLTQLLRFAAQNKRHENPNWQALEELTELPEPTVDCLPLWNAIADMLLVQKGSWRAQVTVKNGFPPGDSKDKEFKSLCVERKKQFKEVVARLKENDEALELLNYIRRLPDPKSEDQQWDFLSALTRVLIHLSGELLLSFSQFGTMDYAQAGSAARNALGDEEHPTDLALSLDHRIQHILVDEFQDTSQLQLEILQQLTTTWATEDSRSLFLVGDAMQSCYGFRNANVGIYLNVREHGIGDLDLESLTLETNFRSQEKIVSWVNCVFQEAFPAQANSSRGAVPYSPSTPMHGPEAEFGVTSTAILHERDDRELAQYLEALEVVQRIKTLQKEDPKASIAILVRSRSHLAKIIPQLRAESISWLATDIDRLGTLPVIEDLLSLTRALLNLSDRVAWLAVLRAPWCGLTSKDLLAIVNLCQQDSIWSGLSQIAKNSEKSGIDPLSAEGTLRLSTTTNALELAMGLRYKVGLRDLVETAWTYLHGFETASNADEFASIAHYFSLLEQYEHGNGLLNIEEFAERVGRSFVSPPKDLESENSVNILTMHKAKGLEYDHIILPGLSRTPVSDDKPLLQWYERLNVSGENRLFLTTAAAAGKEEEKLYKLMRFEQQQKNRLEDTRLLYIAVTRARTSALLLATVSIDAKGEASPPDSSLIGRIWPQLASGPRQIQFKRAADIQNSETQGADSGYSNSSNRVFPELTPLLRFEKPRELEPIEQTLLENTLTLLNPEPEQTENSLEQAIVDIDENSTFDQYPEDNDRAAAIGILIHSSLESYAKTADKKLWRENLDKQANYWRLILRQHIDEESELDKELDAIRKTVKGNVENIENAWIFDHTQEQAASELEITNQFNLKFVVDRTLVDKQGTRWIIDFKTGRANHSQSDAHFVELMIGRYRKQLENYGNLFSAMEQRPIKLALYLTHLEKLVVLEPDEQARS
ncbi:MAG: UvrD-helicase domain-containing protein [Pseudohongiellaceae bacterium]